MAEEKPDPTKDPEFQKVIRHFVTTPPKPHEPIGKAKPAKDGKKSPSGKVPTANFPMSNRQLSPGELVSRTVEDWEEWGFYEALEPLGNRRSQVPLPQDLGQSRWRRVGRIRENEGSIEIEFERDLA